MNALAQCAPGSTPKVWAESMACSTGVDDWARGSRGLRRVAALLAPAETRRGRWLELAAKSWRIVQHNGCRNLVRRAWRKICAGLGIGGREFLSPARYHAWLELREPMPALLDAQRRQARELSLQPRVTIVAAVADSLPAQLREAIDSVRAQIYENWELLLLKPTPVSAEMEAILAEYLATESRIRCPHLSAQLIPGDSEFLAVLDLRDAMAPELLFEVVRRLNEQPDADIVYFDEDDLSADGKRFDPFFKPDWSPELLLSTNYLAHAVVRRALAEARDLACLSKPSEHWDFMLRCAEKARRIEHVPRILYHRRVRPPAGPAETAAQALAVGDHCRRMGLQATISVDAAGGPRVTWPASGAKVSIIIPTKDNARLLRRCLRSIVTRTAYKNYEIILIDNRSREAATYAYYATLRDDARIRIVDYSDSFNYSTANNIGARHALGERLLFLNNDTEVLEPGWLEELVRWADRPEIGAVGPKLLYPNHTIQHAGVILGLEGFCGHIFRGVLEHHHGIFGSVNWYRNFQAVTGACLMMHRTVFEQVGGFDEGYRLGYSDIEICLRLVKHGYRIVYTPFAPMLHHEGRTRFNHLPLPDIRRAYRQMGNSIEAGDPYYNANLSYSHFLPALVEPNEESCRERLRRVMRESGTRAEPAAA